MEIVSRAFFSFFFFFSYPGRQTHSLLEYQSFQSPLRFGQHFKLPIGTIHNCGTHVGELVNEGRHTNGCVEVKVTSLHHKESASFSLSSIELKYN
jgi:hypothetical protein